MTQQDQDWNLDTLLVHSGRNIRYADAAGSPTIHPIYASTTYVHSNATALDQAFSGKAQNGEPAFVYARQGNPNANALESALTQAETGVGAAVFGSGMAAIHAALLAAGLSTGTKIVVSQDIYGPTLNQLQKLFAPGGVTIVQADLCSPEAGTIIRSQEPDVVFIETISNPLVKVVDLDAICAAAREVGATTIVDSTFATPYLIRPIEHGIDIVVHSATKYISGHGDSTGGAAICASNVLLDQLRTYSMLLGATLSPFEIHLMLRGLRTLALRMERHCENALQAARFLQQHPAIAHVYYPGLPDHPHHSIASRLLRHNHFGGLLSFDLKEQTREAAYRFMDRLRLCLPATTLGDVFSLVSYPPLSSHRTITDKERQCMGIHDGCIRFSVGIEHIDDILQDLDQALAH
ncbi:MAG TPA: PLP-dependent aspartate aminotransferase family protein [Ktedonobacteraceae bacterium]|jgi:cystathionine gamma-synthase/methionine-gamma-lyase